MHAAALGCTGPAGSGSAAADPPPDADKGRKRLWLSAHADLPHNAADQCSRLRSMHEESRPRPPYLVKAAVAQLLRQVFSEEPVQDMDFVELFAGEAAVSRGMRGFGYRGWTMDLRISLDHDLLSPAGFLQLLACLARLRPGGVFWAAPPCSTWVFMSRHSTGRDRCVTGNTSSPDVLAQNALVCRLLAALRFCVARGVYFIVEQPHSTVMFEYPPFKQWLASDAATS